MRRMIFLAIGLFLFSIPSFAQEVIYPKAEVFGGFSISSIPGVTTFDPTTGLPTAARKSFMGWQAAANLNLTHHLGIVGDFGGQYGSVAGATVLGVTIPGYSMNSYQFLFGPRVVFRGSRVTPFAQAMFGGIREGIGATTVSVLGVNVTTPAVASTGLGMGIGGGLDINISDRLALRVPQFDWTLRHIAGTTVLGVTVPGTWSTGQIRIGIGLVIKTGEK